MKTILRSSIIIALLFSQGIAAQDKESDCALAMTVPNRMIMISNDDNEAVYRDRKTNAILTFTKAGVTDYEFDLEFTAKQVFEELESDESFEDTHLVLDEEKQHDMYVLSWKQSERAPNKRNNIFSMAMMDICGQYYTFTLNLPQEKKKEMSDLFDELLASIEKTNT